MTEASVATTASEAYEALESGAALLCTAPTAACCNSVTTTGRIFCTA